MFLIQPRTLDEPNSKEKNVVELKRFHCNFDHISVTHNLALIAININEKKFPNFIIQM